MTVNCHDTPTANHQQAQPPTAVAVSIPRLSASLQPTTNCQHPKAVNFPLTNCHSDSQLLKAVSIPRQSASQLSTTNCQLLIDSTTNRLNHQLPLWQSASKWQSASQGSQLPTHQLPPPADTTANRLNHQLPTAMTHQQGSQHPNSQPPTATVTVSFSRQSASQDSQLPNCQPPTSNC
jgi:hypothetical protein